MLLEQLRLLIDYLVHPAKAPSGTLDRGRLSTAIIFALAVALLLRIPAGRTDQSIIDHIEQIQNEMDPEHPNAEQARQLRELAGEIAARRRQPERRLAGWLGAAPENSFRTLFLIAVLFVPVSIVILVRWEGLGRTGLNLQQNYAGLLCCVLLAWTASHLPAALIGFVWSSVWIAFLSLAYFLVLAGFCLRTVLGTRIFPAVGTAIAGAVAMTLGGFVVAAASGLGYLIASPFLIYILYLMWGNVHGDISRLGSGLGRQQSFRRHLEALTLNPRDADAHYQLGLLYLHRRDLEQSESRFRQAAEIDPHDADYNFYLGRVLRERGNPEQALEWLDKAVRINSKAVNNEVWREIGAAHLALNHYDEAASALATFAGRREYDPEGLVLYGQALRRLKRATEARDAFERAIEAARTMPDYRRGQVRRWADLARQELSQLKS